MASKYVYEGVGSNAADGSSASPWATLAYALTTAEHLAGDVIEFKTTAVGRTQPNVGVDGWARCYFVDAANGTDGLSYGWSDGANAYATLQYAMDQISCAAQSAWIFCTGTETLTAQVDLDTGAGAGFWKIIEGYDTAPRDGGYYVLDGGGSVAHAAQWYDVDGVVLANVRMQNVTGDVLRADGISVGPASGGICWNIDARPTGNTKGFIAEKSSTRMTLVACRAEGDGYHYRLARGEMVLLGCVSVDGGMTSYSCADGGTMVCHRCVADSPAGHGFLVTVGMLVALDCLAYDTGGDGFESCDGDGTMVAVGCVSVGNGRYGIARQSWTDDLCWGLVLNGLAYDNTTGDYGNVGAMDGLLTSDPQIVDAANGDFGVAAGSPCINGGVDLHAVLTDETVHIGPYSPCGVFGPGGMGAKVAYPGAAF